ncbi:MAG: hypothetical protein LC802_06845, partial [Acidobacteria bacterium]|nr:hypothetical protein [Acidobacteriota bacterium]
MTIRRSLFALLSLFACAAPGLAQETARPAQEAAPTVTVSATASGVRFAALGAVKQTRLEVYDSSGAPVFDSGFLPGNVRDFAPRAAGISDGSYACVLTSRELSGRLSIKQAAVLLRGGEVSLALGEAEAAGEVGREQAAPASAGGDEAGAATLATHDGRDGAVTATSGDLTLRTGDILSGGDTERVRITTEGKVGIGTDKPEAMLDVAGAVRASEGYRFADGTTLKAENGKLAVTNSAGDPAPGPAAAGTGTVNRLAKWLETGGAGTLGDSVVTEAATGFIGIGTTNPEFPLHIEHPTFAQAFVSGGTAADFLMFHRNAPPNARFTGLRSQDGKGKFSSFNDNRTFRHEAIIAWDNATGNVGIGTVNAGAKLDVVGNINTSTQYNIGGQRVLLSSASTGNLFAGAGAGQNTGGFGVVSNSFFGFNAGSANTSGTGNAFFGTAAGDTNQTGTFNTIIGTGADVGPTNLTNATAIGQRALVTQSNSLVLGSINGQNGATTDTSVGIGTTAPSARLHVRDNGGNVLLGNAGCSSGFVGIGFGANLSGCNNYSLLGNGAETRVSRPEGGALSFLEGNST